MEMMIRVFVGEEDEDSKRAREKLAKAWRAAGEKLPFKNPVRQSAGLDLMAA